MRVSRTVPLAVLLLLPPLGLASTGHGLDDAESHTVLVHLGTDKFAYLPGESVLANASVTNLMNRTVMIKYPSSSGGFCQERLLVRDAAGHLWNDGYPRGPGWACTAAEGIWILRPGDVRSFTYVWNQEDDNGTAVPVPGVYVLRFQLELLCCQLEGTPSFTPFAEVFIFIGEKPSSTSGGGRTGCASGNALVSLSEGPAGFGSSGNLGQIVAVAFFAYGLVAMSTAASALGRAHRRAWKVRVPNRGPSRPLT